MNLHVVNNIDVYIFKHKTLTFLSTFFFIQVASKNALVSQELLIQSALICSTVTFLKDTVSI